MIIHFCSIDEKIIKSMANDISTNSLSIPTNLSLYQQGWIDGQSALLSSPAINPSSSSIQKKQSTLRREQYHNDSGKVMMSNSVQLYQIQYTNASLCVIYHYICSIGRLRSTIGPMH